MLEKLGDQEHICDALYVYNTMYRDEIAFWTSRSGRVEFVEAVNALDLIYSHDTPNMLMRSIARRTRASVQCHLSTTVTRSTAHT